MQLNLDLDKNFRKVHCKFREQKRYSKKVEISVQDSDKTKN